MSQEKVDKRKADKRNRKQELAKKKKKRVMNIILSIVATVAFIAIVIGAAMALATDGFQDETTISSENGTAISAEELQELLNAVNGTTTEDTTSAEDTTADAAETETTTPAAETETTTPAEASIE